MIEVTVSTLDEAGTDIETFQVPVEAAPHAADTLERIFASPEWEAYKRRHPLYENYLSVTIEFGDISITVTNQDGQPNQITGTFSKQSHEEDTGGTPNS